MSQFVRVTESIDSWVRFTMPYAGIVTAQCDFRSTDKTGGVGFGSFSTNNHWRIAWMDGSTSTIMYLSNFYINNVLSNSVAANRDQLADVLCTGEWMTLKYVGWSANISDFSTAFGVGQILEFCNYRFQNIYCPNADIKNFKIDIGNTGTWTHESELGDTNGFYRNNVTILSDVVPSRRRRHTGGFGL